MVEPHGGYLIESYLTNEEAEIYQNQMPSLKQIIIDDLEKSDLELICNGAYSPLDGFIGEKDYHSVLSDNRLSSGLIWTLPIVLGIPAEDALHYKEGETVALISKNGEFLGILFLEDKYLRNIEQEAKAVFGTIDLNHPGVNYLFHKGDVLLSGKTKAVKERFSAKHSHYNLSPQETRLEFKKRCWKSVVAFQTRNPIHRAHEYLQKVALELVDGLLIHPLVGFTKSDDIPPEIRISCYEALLKNYYPVSRVMLSTFPAAMRYAGPMEAVFHAIVRKNYGCSHFIVGRDHAGVGNYYGTYDAQNIFDQFSGMELGMTILKFENTFFCKKCGNMASRKTCPHQGEDLVFFSGTKVREMLSAGAGLPEEFTRPEVSKILASYYQMRK